MAGISQIASRPSSDQPRDRMSLLGESLTPHARVRMQQRGISAAALDALLDFGRVANAGGGRDIVFFDKQARARLARAKAVAAAEAERVCKSYAIVESDGTVITVGHRYRRIARGR